MCASHYDLILEAAPGFEEFIRSALPNAASSHHTPLYSRIAALCRQFLEQYENLDYAPTTNGEARVLQIVANYFGPPATPVFFDVGSNHGAWSDQVLAHCPQVELHLFELIPALAQALVSKFQSQPRVHCNEFGLSNRAGHQPARYFPEADALSSLFLYPHPLASTEVQARLEVGAEYAQTHGIEEIHFCKLDVEGAEHLVLDGFRPLLEAQKIQVIQFEYGKINILTHFLLIDFYRELSRYGFRIGKIYPRSVEFRDYLLDQEDFIGPNF